jgi:hypothetical protein
MIVTRQASWGVLGALALGAGGIVLLSKGAQSRAAPAIRDDRHQPDARQLSVVAARRLNRASGVLACSVLADSAIEHYRGSFHNKAMFAPLLSSALSLAASVHGVADRRAGAHRARDTVYALAAAVGTVGLGFHAYNVGKRPGGYSWLNLFYAAPLGAPAALVLSGLLGFVAERVRDNERGTPVTVFGRPAGRVVAAVTATGLVGTVGEAGLLHFRGAYHDPAMFAPVTLPPVAAALLAGAAVRLSSGSMRLARWWLRATSALGFAGVAFHTYGVSRNMGGWSNWRQNLLNGPPLPAPPSFTGLALAGLAALDLLEEQRDG